MMKDSKLFLMVFSLGLMLGLNGCSGGGGGNPPVVAGNTLSGVASMGLLNGATITVYALDASGNQGAVLGTTTTDSNGAYSLDIGSYTGNVLVVATGGTYTDEATNKIMDNGGVTLSAALTGVSGDVSVAVTPLTDIAVKYAGSSLTKEAIDGANYLVSTMVGVDVVHTMPTDAIDQAAAATATVDGIAYGLALASLSQMMDSQGLTVSTVIDTIKADLSDDGQLDDTGGVLSSALTTFLASSNNKTGVVTLEETKLDDAITAIETTAVTIPADVEVSDLAKAKSLVADLRNTALSIYNYQGAGMPGVVETPFNNLAEELETTIEPELTSAFDRLGWIIDVTTDSIESMAPGTSEAVDTYSDGALLTLTLTKSTDGKTVTFDVKDGNVPVDSGTITTNEEITPDSHPTSGTVAGTLETPNGTLAIDLTYAGTKNSSGQYTAMTFTGSMSAPGGLSFDFKESGRKISVTYAKEPTVGATIDDIYPTSIYFSGRITTGTAQMDGTLDISSIKWNSKSGNCSSATGGVVSCTGLALPAKGTFTGSFSELKGGVATGAKFSGTLTGNWTNADTYDVYAENSTTNVAQWDASFDGKIEAPSRPTITAFLKVAQSEYQKYALNVSYNRTNTDGSVVSLSGSGTAMEKISGEDPTDMHPDRYAVLEASLTNQNGLVVNITLDGSKSGDGHFTGAIETSGGTGLADLYSMEGVPTVKYADDSFESIF